MLLKEIRFLKIQISCARILHKTAKENSKNRDLKWAY